MSWWQRSEEEIPACGGPGPICWGGMGVVMLLSGGTPAAMIWGAVGVLTG